MKQWYASNHPIMPSRQLTDTKLVQGYRLECLTSEQLEEIRQLCTEILCERANAVQKEEEENVW